METTHIISGYGLSVIFLILASFSPFSSSIMSEGNKFPYMTSDVTEVSGKSFDYIVVGGGAAGCPLAATLSQRFSVLLVERGGSPYGNNWITESKYMGFPLLQTDEFSSIAQSFISKDGVPNARGRVLGGSSAINFGFYSRASDDTVSRAGWDKKLVKEAYEWVEARIVSTPDQLSKFQSALKFGMLEAEILPYNGFTLEHKQGTKIGGSLFDNYGKRHFAADLLRAGNPDNLIVLLNATVKNVIFHESGIKYIRHAGKVNESIVHGISFIKSDGSTNETYEAYLKEPKGSTPVKWGDVILSAGALGSPQVLMLSGIGPKSHLKNFDIALILDLEWVGREMQDNPRLDIGKNVKFQDSNAPNVAGIAKDFKFIYEGVIVPSSINTSTAGIACKVAFPESRGKLELNNTDPRQNPLVEFNYLENKKDLKECVKLVRLLERIASSKSMIQWVRTTQPYDNSTITSPLTLREFCKKNITTFWHYHGGCNVGLVVSEDYKVYGTKGLRVIDGSTLWESPGTNPVATILMLGRYGGIKILKEREN